jgi:hypothetical protein
MVYDSGRTMWIDLYLITRIVWSMMLWTYPFDDRSTEEILIIAQVCDTF